MFEDSTFESAGRIHTRSRWMIAAFALNGSILLALIIIPLIDPEALPRHAIPILMEAPLLASTPEPPKPQPVHVASGGSAMPGEQIAAPVLIHAILVGPGKPEAARPFEVSTVGLEPSSSGSPNVVFPGQTARPVVRPAPKGPVRVSSRAEGVLLLRQTLPTYPSLTRVMRLEGTVVLAATISKTGTIENLRVVSGPAILQQAALDAVKSWLYRPYVLDGQPVEVETTVNVIFNLGR